MRKGLAGAVALGVLLVFASAALSAASFSDVAGDDNAAPDVTEVKVSRAADGALTVSVAVANYQALPERSWFNIWFDLDNDDSTGDFGDEAVIHFPSSGEIVFRRWDGSQLVEQSSVGMSGRFEAGVLTLTTPISALDSVSTFGVLAVSSRSQEIGLGEFVASDFAPGSGRSLWTGAADLQAYPDPPDDQDAAPDVTSVRVTDAKDGWISFAISTPNFATLPVEDLILLSIDADNRASTGDDGAELLLTYAGGQLRFERWNADRKAWRADGAPSRVRARNANGVATLDIHRSEIGEAARFGFSIAAADVNPADGSPLAADFAPDDLGFYGYSLANKPALRLLVGKTIGVPARPRAGRPFTVSMPVRRSDTNQVIRSGSVSCTVTAGGQNVRATGRVRGGRAQCAFLVPENASTVRGSMTVRSGGSTVTARFSFRVG